MAPNAKKSYKSLQDNGTVKASPLVTPRDCFPTAPPDPRSNTLEVGELDDKMAMSRPWSVSEQGLEEHFPSILRHLEMRFPHIQEKPEFSVSKTTSPSVWRTQSLDSASRLLSVSRAQSLDFSATGSYWQEASGLGRPCNLVGELQPGDVLSVVEDNFALSQLGASGGYLGHVLLVVAHPRQLKRRSPIGEAFEDCWGDGGQNDLYMVSIVECCRNAQGLTENDLVVSIDGSGRILMLGDYSRHGCHQTGDVVLYQNQKEVHVWRSPARFRGQNFRFDVMNTVLEDMRSIEQSWSWSTALRAVFLSSEISSEPNKTLTMDEIQNSWEAEPICTSVIVIFWQRYLHKLAALQSIEPHNLILEFMPIRADRVLPGELLSSMLSSGWSLWSGTCTLKGYQDRRVTI